MVNDTEAANHLLEKTFKRICANIYQYKQSNLTFLTWALQLARAESVEYLCITKPKAMLTNDLPEKTRAGGTATDDLVVLNMIHQGYKVYEISEMLHLPVEDVKTSIRNAMKQKRNFN